MEMMQPNFNFEGAAEKADKNVKPQTEFCKKKSVYMWFLINF